MILSWILSNHITDECKDKVQLVNATDQGEKMRKSLGSKRKYLTEAQSFGLCSL